MRTNEIRQRIREIRNGDLVLVINSSDRRYSSLFYSDGRAALIGNLGVSEEEFEEIMSSRHLRWNHTELEIRRIVEGSIEKGKLSEFLNIFGRELGDRTGEDGHISNWRYIITKTPGVIFGYDLKKGFLNFGGKDIFKIEFGGITHTFERPAASTLGHSRIHNGEEGFYPASQKNVYDIITGSENIRKYAQETDLDILVKSGII